VWWVRPPDPIERERFSCEVVPSTRNGRVGHDHKFRSHGAQLHETLLFVESKVKTCYVSDRI
jgi:hypothetical protein